MYVGAGQTTSEAACDGSRPTHCLDHDGDRRSCCRLPPAHWFEHRPGDERIGSTSRRLPIITKLVYEPYYQELGAAERRRDGATPAFLVFTATRLLPSVQEVYPAARIAKRAQTAAPGLQPGQADQLLHSVPTAISTGPKHPRPATHGRPRSCPHPPTTAFVGTRAKLKSKTWV